MKPREDFLKQHEDKIAGVLGCYDRVVMTGTLGAIAHPAAMAGVLMRKGVRCFDLGEVLNPLREQIRQNAENLAKQDGLRIQYLPSIKGVRKEAVVQEVLAKRGGQPGLVHIFSAMETCTTFKPWHDKQTGRTSVQFTTGKCLHYYFYLMDPDLGLMYVRVPTWAPFRLQVYFNGHHLLASRLKNSKAAFRMEDNAFVEVSNWSKAQQLSDELAIEPIHAKLDKLAAVFCPVCRHFVGGYHWSTMQVEYSLDIVFKDPQLLQPIYEEISRQAILAVRIDDMARFWDKRLSPQAQATSDFKTVIEGTRIKHRLGKQSIKMYDKGGRVLRIEATSNDVTFFRHHRKVDHRDGSWEYKCAALKKSIYSLTDLDQLLAAACRRYLDFIATLDDKTDQRHDLDRISRPVRDDQDRSWRGFNLFLAEDLKLLLAVLRGEFTLHGLDSRRLRRLLPDKNKAQVTRMIKRLRLHGLIRKVAHSYRYYLTSLGRRLLIAARKLTEFIILPSLSPATASSHT